MPLDRLKCQTERWHAVLTVWPTRHHRDRQGWAIRVASGTLSADGTVLRPTDAAGRVYELPPLLPPSVEVGNFLSLAAQSMSFTIPWIWDAFNPVDIDLRYAVGELAILWETSNGTAVEAWDLRDVRLSGAISGVAWGNNREEVSFTLGEEELTDTGQFWGPRAEMSSDYFTEIADTDERDRAQYSQGLLPPLVYAPVGSALRSPCLCWKNEVDANKAGAIDWRARLYIIGKRQPSSPTSNHQFAQVSPLRNGAFMDAENSSTYRAIPTTSGYKGYGSFAYITADFQEVVGNGSVSTSNGSFDVTATKTKGKLAVGDYLKDIGDGYKDFAIAESVDGSSVTLDRAYTGTGAINSEVDIARLPPPIGYQLYHINTLGGDASPDGSGPITNAVDVLIDAFRYAQLPVPIDFGDLYSIRDRVRGVNISAVLNERAAPSEWALGKVLEWLPIRPYRSGGRLRFAWVGTVREEEIQTTLDLDELGSAYRLDPIAYNETEVYPVIRMRYWWDVFWQRYRSSITQDGSPSGGARDSTQDGWYGTGRGREAFAAWVERSGVKSARSMPTLDLEIDTLEQRTAAGLASSWLLYRYGQPRQTVRLEIDQTLHWLQPGDVIRATETGVTCVSQRWRVQGTQISPMGTGTLILESVPS